MIKNLNQPESQIQTIEDEIAQVVTPAMVREFFPNDPMRFSGDPLAKTFEPEEIQAIDEAVSNRDPDANMEVLSREDRLLFAENISQELLTRYRRGGNLTEEEGNFYQRVNSLGALRDDCRKLTRARKERDE